MGASGSLARRCPVCDGGSVEVLRTAQELTEDTLWTQALFSRGDSRVEAGMLRDTALFTQSYHAALLSCGACGSLFRDPASVPADRLDRYITDRYDPDYLDRMWVAFISAYQRDHAWNQRHGVRPGARLLEIGSWFGAFLTYASHHGVDAIGLDLGTSASRYARAHGASVIPTGFNLAALEGQRFDSVWCLNCFEQLPDPRTVLVDAASLLVPGGHLVVRTPSADFIRLAYERMPRAAGRRLLAGTNLGGVAYAVVFSRRALANLLRESSYIKVRVRGRAHRSAALRAFRGTPLGSRHVRSVLYQAGSLRADRLGWPWMDVTAVRGLACT